MRQVRPAVVAANESTQLGHWSGLKIRLRRNEEYLPRMGAAGGGGVDWSTNVEVRRWDILPFPRNMPRMCSPINEMATAKVDCQQ